MFKIDFDLTGGRLRSGRTALTRVGAVSTSRRKTASSVRRGFGDTLGQGQVPQLAGQGLSQQYSPVFDRAEVPDLGQQFLPADSASQNKLFRQIVTFDAIVGSAIEYWKDLAFSERVILSATDDPKIDQFYQEAIEASGITGIMPMLLHDFLVFGRFVFHMLYDSRLEYWTRVIPHDLDYLHIDVSPIPGMEPLIDLLPNAQQRAWAVSKDPRAVEQRSQIDPAIVKLMAAGKQIPLDPEDTMFLPRMAFSTDRIGTSYLTRVLMFKVYESAIYNASVAGARRRAGPLLHIKAWPDALPHELDELLDLFFSSEEDPVNAKVVTKDGVTVEQIGGAAADYWRFSEEWPFLVEGKMRALGISEQFLQGEANWNSMETIRTIFVDKLQSMRSFFTQRIIVDKMLTQLAMRKKFVKRTTAELNHRIRIAKPINRGELIIPTVEWNRPLTPTRDEDYLNLLNQLKDEGFPIPLRDVAQAAGLDLEKMMDGWKTDLSDRKRIYHFKKVLSQLQTKMGIDPEGNVMEAEEGPGGGEFDFGGGEEDFGFGEEEEFGFGEEEPGGAPEVEAPEPGAAEEGFGAGLSKKRFPTPPAYQLGDGQEVYGYRMPGKTSIIDLLSDLPVWDDDGTMFGVPKRFAAKTLLAVANTDPNPNSRARLADRLYKRLRKDGFTDLQAQSLEYLAMRLGYLPAGSLNKDILQLISRMVLGKVNGSGLTAEIKDELIALSKLGCGQQPKPVLHKGMNWTNHVKTQDQHLPESQLLTGYIDPTTKKAMNDG